MKASNKPLPQYHFKDEVGDLIQSLGAALHMRDKRIAELEAKNERINSYNAGRNDTINRLTQTALDLKKENTIYRDRMVALWRRVCYDQSMNCPSLSRYRQWFDENGKAVKPEVNEDE